MKMAEINLDINLTKQQTKCFDAFFNPTVKAVLYGGARGGGKSVMGCLLSFLYAVNVINTFNLSPNKYPVPVGFMGRAQSVDFTDTTLETWKKFIPLETYTIRSQDKEIVILDTVKFAFGGLDRTEDVKKFTSAEYGMIFLDQAEECSRDAVADLRACLRQKINGKELPYKELYTANPYVENDGKKKNPNLGLWLKKEFVQGNDSTKVYIPALPSDNEYLPAGYIDQLKEAYRHRPELLEAYLYGSWDTLSGTNVVIQEEWIRQAKAVANPYERPPRIISADIARYGDDATVIYLMEGTDIVDEKILNQKDTMTTATEIAIWAREERPVLIGVDTIGVGAGVADRLRQLGYEVIDINSSERSKDPEKFINLRAEMWWTAAENFADNNIKLTWEDEDLINELTAATYEIKNGKIQIESKDDLKAKLGHSPDKADAYIQGLYLLQFAGMFKTIKEYEDWGYAYAVKHSSKYSGL